MSRATETATWDEQLARSLRERGQRVTSQRLLIHRALRDLDRHVSAEEVLAAVSPSLPNVSLPTVYATLDLFRELGIVRRVSAGRDAILYDPRGEPHHHLVCRSCSRVEDLEAGVDVAPALRAAGRRGFAADGAELVITGSARTAARQLHGDTGTVSRVADAAAILDLVRSIPEGTVTTYGDLCPGAPRHAGAVLAECTDRAVPWHRVVRADGSLAKGDRQRRLLEREGVPFRGGRVDMEQAWVAVEAVRDSAA